MHELKVNQLEAKIRGLEEENKQKDGLIAELRENIRLLEKEIRTTD